MENLIENKNEQDHLDLNRLKNDWRYSDLTFEEWEANGALLTEKGLPSKLNKIQFEQVRSKKFKDRFGDWLENPENSSLLIDKDSGEPQVFYRGDASKYKDEYLINHQMREKFGKDNKSLMGIFFTNKKKVAESYENDPNLGTFGLTPEDFPENYEIIFNHLKSITDTDRMFWNTVLNYFEHDHGSSDMNYLSTFMTKEDARELLDYIRSNNAINKRIDNGKFLKIFLSNYELFSKMNFDGLFNVLKVSPPNPLTGKQQSRESMGENVFRSNQKLSDKLRKYIYEPRITRGVFINGRKIIRIYKPNNPEDQEKIWRAYKDGYDIVIGENAVGSGTADEVIVFEPKNIIFSN